MTSPPPPIPAEPVRAEPPAVPELDVEDLDARPLVAVEGRPGAGVEWLLPEALACLEAGALVVYAPAPEGWPGRLRVRLYRYSGPAWYRGTWCGRGEWYASAHVPAAVPWAGRRSLNVYLGKWRAPGGRSRAANAKPSPPPLSPEGVRHAVQLVRECIDRKTGSGLV